MHTYIEIHIDIHRYTYVCSIISLLRAAGRRTVCVPDPTWPPPQVTYLYI